MTGEAARKSAMSLIDRLMAGETQALARAITIVENNRPGAADIQRAIQPDLGRAHVVGFTGPPGAGKSTLINAYVSCLREQDLRVAIAAVDPSSPISGGAILGDRIRMGRHVGDRCVYVRSLASRGQSGGLSAATARVIDVMDASGADIVIVETVGAGQGDVEIAELADTKVVLSAPGLGDGIQAIKAGILEIADLLVVNKGDLPLAETTVRQLEAMLELRDKTTAASQVPVLITEAINDKGIGAMTEAIQAHGQAAAGAGRRDDPSGRIRRLIADAAGRLVKERYRQSGDAELKALGDAVQRGEIDIDSAARQLLQRDG